MKLGYTISGVGAFNILHFRKLGTVAVDQTLTNNAGAAIKSAWTTNIAPLTIPTVALIRVSLRDLTTANQPELLDAGAAVGGTGTGEALPASLAICVTLKTALAGKSNRGRVYISGFNEAQNTTGGVVIDAANTAAVNFITAIKNALAPMNLFLCVASRPANGSVTTKVTTFQDGSTESEVLSRISAKPGGTTDVNLIQARNAQWEQQRKRTNGRGAAPTSAIFQVSV